MDTLIFVGQLACLAGLAYGAWICLCCAGKYDAETARADVSASRSSRTRAHLEPPVQTATVREVHYDAAA